MVSYGCGGFLKVSEVRFDLCSLRSFLGWVLRGRWLRCRLEHLEQYEYFDDRENRDNLDNLEYRVPFVFLSSTSS